MQQHHLPFSVDDCKKVCEECPYCKIVKLKFFNKRPGTLVKATQPMERVSIDLKDPQATSSRGNKYLLIIVDEYSRFPWAYPLRNATSANIIRSLRDFFATYGTPGFIHSDRGSQFVSRETTAFLSQSGVPTSRSTPYHPQGNSQVERLIGTIWRAVQCGLESTGQAKSK